MENLYNKHLLQNNKKDFVMESTIIYLFFLVVKDIQQQDFSLFNIKKLYIFCVW